MSDLENLNVLNLSDDELAQVTGGKKITVIAKTEANVRSGPGKEYSVISKTIPGFEAKFDGQTFKDKQGRVWCHVSWNGRSGWISSKYISRA